jgi:hypothetical protein
MRTRIVPALMAGAFIVSPAFAVDFGVMETADVVEPGDFKFIAFPLTVRDGPRREHDAGVNVGLGYGLGRNLDVEGQIGVYDDITFFGADLEWTYRADRPLELSIGGGAHAADSDFGNPWGLDVTHIASYTLPAIPRMRLIGAIDAAYERADSEFAAAVGANYAHYWVAYAVPAVQYRITELVDVIAEVGVGLNSDSNDYIAAGISYYFGHQDEVPPYSTSGAATRAPNNSASKRSPSSSTK